MAEAKTLVLKAMLDNKDFSDEFLNAVIAISNQDVFLQSTLKSGNQLYCDQYINGRGHIKESKDASDITYAITFGVSFFKTTDPDLNYCDGITCEYVYSKRTPPNSYIYVNGGFLQSNSGPEDLGGGKKQYHSTGDFSATLSGNSISLGGTLSFQFNSTEAGDYECIYDVKSSLVDMI